MYDYDEDDEEYNLQQQAQTANVMDQFGFNLAAGTSSDYHQQANIERRREQRIKRGECPNCRRKTHKVSRWGKKRREPLTIDGEVDNGNCLRCKPILSSPTRPKGVGQQQQPPAIPDTLYAYDHDDEDDLTVASEITMDPYLTADRGPPGGRYRSLTKGGSNRSLAKSAGSGQFESVAEEDEMTDFGKHAQEVAGHISQLENERRERERDIVREHEGGRRLKQQQQHTYNNRQRRQYQQHHGGQRGGRILEEEESEEDSDESESIGEDHEQIIRKMEQQHKFHPLATAQINTFSNSEPSMSSSTANKTNNDDSRPEENNEQSSYVSGRRLTQESGTTFTGSSYVGGRRLTQESGMSSLSASNRLGESLNLSNRDGDNELSLSNREGRQTQESGTSSSATPPAVKQTFHPLAQMAIFNQSERSISVNSTGQTVDSSQSQNESVKSTDSDRIARLCQGSRSSLAFDGGEISPASKKEEHDITKKKTPPRSKYARDSRFRMKRLSSGDGSSGEEENDADQQQPMSRLDTIYAKQPAIEEDTNRTTRRITMDAAPPTTRKSGARRLTEGSANRFSLTGIDDALKTRSLKMKSNVYGRPNSGRSLISEEMNASKNWESMDILRDAAAEANGEDLDAEIDAMFSLKGSSQSREPLLDSMISKSDDEKEENDDDDDDDDDDIKNMTEALSRFSANEEESISTAISQRRNSLPSNAVQLSTIKDIPAIIQTVKSQPSDVKVIERAFQSLFLLATENDPAGAKARQEILDKGGMETMILSLWHHMQSSTILLALFQALWAISADETDNSDVAISQLQETRALEGLLFAMQTHATDMSIQESGCDLITRMTGLLPFDSPDFKSAVLLLAGNIKNMDTNGKAYSSCLDALNSLCQLSDENKLAIAKAGSGCHDNIIRGMTSSELETRELSCELFWCVTSNRAATSSLSSDGQITKKIMDALKDVSRTKSSVHFYSAACGTLANLALDASNHSRMIDLPTVQVLCESIYVYDSEDVNSAACTALANLSASKDIRNDVVSQGGIPALFSAMKACSNNVDIQNEVLRALNNLCDSSKDGMSAIVGDLELIITTYFRHNTKYIQQITCSIINRLSTNEECRKDIVKVTQTFNALAKIMKANHMKKLVLKAACSALSNLSKEEDIIQILLSKPFSALAIDAMDVCPDCEELQTDACTFLMNMGSNKHLIYAQTVNGSSNPEASVEICSAEGIHCIIKAMQTFPTSASLQQTACGAINAITKGDAHKDLALNAGVVDVILYSLLVHPDDVNVLENAMDCLVSLSLRSTKIIANAGGISTVTETLRSNQSSVDLIISGARFIQNMAIADREYANEALSTVTPILNCMKGNPNHIKLVEESCKALRCLVLKSESCKDKVLSSGGVAIIEKTIEENSTSRRWQTLLLDELFE